MVLAALLAAAACAGGRTRPTAPVVLPFAADTSFTTTLRPGIVQQFLYASSGPWAIHVLQVELNGCNRALAVKGAPGAAGRTRTSAMLTELSKQVPVVAGVNADFFSLSNPPGVPTGALIVNGRVIAGPSAQPVLAFTSSRRPFIGVLSDTGSATIGKTRHAIAAWNHRAPGGIALFDSNWGPATDTASSVIEIVLGRSQRVVSVDTMPPGVAIPAGGVVLIIARDAPSTVRSAFLALRPGDRVQVSVGIGPFHPREAIGGRPLLIRDSTIVPEVDTEGQPGFANGRHPRTAAGIAGNGSQLILAVVDGRQAPRSDGMTLRELASLMLALGARDAVNLDGGGSTTFVSSAREDQPLRVVNRPSDPLGERTVGDALAIVRTCR